MRFAAVGSARGAFLRHHARRVPAAFFSFDGLRARCSRSARLTLLGEVPSVRAVTEARVAVLASGEGTNLQALLDDPVVRPWVVLAVSDRASARALERARSHDVETVFIDPAAYDGRASFDRALLDVLRARSIDVVALAGFMRIVGSEVVRAFTGRMLNVHPALLPAFPGTSSVADALAWGVKLTGVTVHFVDEQVDHGPIVFQEAVPVLPSDDWDSLEERVHEVEHRLLPAAIRALVEGRIQIDGRMVRVLEEAPA
jgi:phosphoribosylglycinamide formyltransferase 1